MTVASMAATWRSIKQKFGFSDQLDFAFINADGTISALFPL
jgi:hypothetical protein